PPKPAKTFLAVPAVLRLWCEEENYHRAPKRCAMRYGYTELKPRLPGTSRICAGRVTSRWRSPSPEVRALPFAGSLGVGIFFYRGDLHALALDVQPQPGKYTHIDICHPHQRETGN